MTATGAASLLLLLLLLLGLAAADASAAAAARRSASIAADEDGDAFASNEDVVPDRDRDRDDGSPRTSGGGGGLRRALETAEGGGTLLVVDDFEGSAAASSCAIPAAACLRYMCMRACWAAGDNLLSVASDEKRGGGSNSLYVDRSSVKGGKHFGRYFAANDAESFFPDGTSNVVRVAYKPAQEGNTMWAKVWFQVLLADGDVRFHYPEMSWEGGGANGWTVASCDFVPNYGGRGVRWIKMTVQQYGGSALESEVFDSFYVNSIEVYRTTATAAPNPAPSPATTVPASAGVTLDDFEEGTCDRAPTCKLYMCMRQCSAPGGSNELTLTADEKLNGKRSLLVDRSTVASGHQFGRYLRGTDAEDIFMDGVDNIVMVGYKLAPGSSAETRISFQVYFTDATLAETSPHVTYIQETDGWTIAACPYALNYQERSISWMKVTVRTYDGAAETFESFHLDSLRILPADSPEAPTLDDPAPLPANDGAPVVLDDFEGASCLDATNCLNFLCVRGCWTDGENILSITSEETLYGSSSLLVDRGTVTSGQQFGKFYAGPQTETNFRGGEKNEVEVGVKLVVPNGSRRLAAGGSSIAHVKMWFQVRLADGNMRFFYPEMRYTEVDGWTVASCTFEPDYEGQPVSFSKLTLQFYEDAGFATEIFDSFYLNFVRVKRAGPSPAPSMSPTATVAPSMPPTTYPSASPSLVDVESRACLDSAVSLSALVADAASSDSAVVVPRGRCCVVDYSSGETVTLPRGFEVDGRLHFGPSANVTLDATHIFVRGVWSMEPPAAGNGVKIAFHGTEERTLLGENVGKKAFVVAGGKLDIAAIDPACPSWTKLKDVVLEGSVARGLKVGPEFASCVKAGEEVLITSHVDNGWDKHTVASVRSVDEADGVIYLEGSVVPGDVPTEAGPSDEPRFAVEVARLGRDVVFEGRRDDSARDGLHGAHLMILRTAGVAQKISGVAFENFGQQGVLGRYPIHFHMCGSVAGSVVSKNVVRRSNQRCVVIHGTHDARVEDNVAYDTAGHCFVVEDGAETNNTFERNLGARTKYSIHGVGASDIDDDVGHSGVSTFWITNPSNHFIGNVAAGSQEVGFWFHTIKEVNGPSANLTENADVVPQYLDLGTFRDNVGHTNAVSGLWLYKIGWQPSSEALLENTALYKNKEGMFWHNNRNIIMKGALIADNAEGVVFVQNTLGTNRIEDAEIIGMSEDTKSRHNSTCQQASYSGVRFAWNEGELSQLDMETVRFAGFGGIGCPTLALEPFHTVLIDDNTALGSMHPRGLTFDSEENKIELPCDMVPEGGYKNFLFEDFDGTIGPSAGRPGFIVHNEAHMKAFAGNCSDLYRGSCAAWCENVCLRRVKVETDADQDCKMVVTSDADGTTYTYDKNTIIDRYEAVLQSGQYTFHFEDVAGNLSIPSYAGLELGEAPLCPDHVTESSIVIVRSTCPDSITRADGTADSGTFGVRKLWSGATVVDIASEGGNNYFTHTLLANGIKGGFLVELDLDCATSGETYVFDAKYRSSGAVAVRPYFSLFWRSSGAQWRSRNPIAVPSRPYTGAGVGFVRGSATFTLTDEMLDPLNMFGLCVLIDWGKDNDFQADYDDILFQKS